MNGAATNPDAHVVAYAAAAVKKGLEVAKKLGAENYGVASNKAAQKSYHFRASLIKLSLFYCLCQCSGEVAKATRACLTRH